MTRHKVIDGQTVQFTQAEEDARDAEEKVWADGATKRDVMKEIERLESTVTQRRIREMTTADGAKWVDDVEKLIAVERGKL